MLTHAHPTDQPEAVTVRLGRATDSGQLADLAGLNCAAVPEGAVMVAETGGSIVAAVPVDGGPAIADPFRRTAAVISLLKLRAAQMGA
ncbi:MAG TPA: hypothetical protein VFY44_10755 [Thermoleophilaceae bacterium]|nr:hypothetical protein [Thermoleophilaceae bacterium]